MLAETRKWVSEWSTAIFKKAIFTILQLKCEIYLI